MFQTTHPELGFRRIVKPWNGYYHWKILFNGTDIKKLGLTKHRQKNVALIFQNFNLLNYMSAVENVMTAMEISKSCKHDRKKQALNLLADLCLTEDEGCRNVMELSCGQQQRVTIARALVTDADVILADEPTGNLDSKTSGEIIEILKELAHKYNKGVIVVSHSIDYCKNGMI